MQSCNFSLSMMTLQQTSNLQYRMGINSTKSMGINSTFKKVPILVSTCTLSTYLKTFYFHIMIHLDVQNMDIEEQYLNQYFFVLSNIKKF